MSGQDEPASEPQPSLARRVAIPLGLFALAFAVRCVTWPRVFPRGFDGPVFLFGTDAYYHMRRVLYTLANFPDVLRFDPYINFPNGGEPIWSPLFDATLAALILPFSRGENPLVAEQIAVFVPPLLGAATVVALHEVARRAFGPAVGLLAALLLCFLSGHFWYSQLGFVDHHAAVAWLAVVLLGAVWVWLRRLAVGSADSGDLLLPALATGFVGAVLLLVWPGGLLHVGLVVLALLAWLAASADRGVADRIARSSALAWTTAALLVAPAALFTQWQYWGAFSPTVLSRFQPWLFSALAVHALACHVAFRSERFGGSRAARGATVLGLGAATLVVSVVLFPGLVDGAASALGWLLKEETFQRVVAESKPLFDDDGRRVAEVRLSRFLYLAPFTAAWLAWRARRDPAGLFVVFFAVALLAITLVQRRFFNSSSIGLALLFGWGLHAVWRLAAGHARARLRRPVASALVGAIALWLLYPVATAYHAPILNVGQALRGEPLGLPPGLVRQRAFRRAALWLRANSPPPGEWLAPEAAPSYGVLASWTHGHLIEYVARRPAVADNFGDDLGPENFLASFRYFEAEEPEARALLARLCVRYVLFRTAVGEDLEAFPEASMNHRLSAATPEVPHLRLVYDEPMPVRGGPSQIRIFEARTPPTAACANRARARGVPTPNSGPARRL